MKKLPSASVAAKRSASVPVAANGVMSELTDIPCVLGGSSKELFIPRPVLRRTSQLQKTTPAKLIETLKILHGVSVTICDWPTDKPFFLVAGTERHFPEDKKASCCNCQKELCISGDAPDTAVPICAQCVRFQAILASAHGVTHH